MEKVKLAIVYYSFTGTNQKMAKWAAEAAQKAGAEVKILKVKEVVPQAVIDADPMRKANDESSKDIPEVSNQDLEWADAFLFSFPTRFGMMPSQIKSFLDQTGPLWAEGKLANKVVSAMTSAQNQHGGQEATILSFYTMMYHWGAIVASPGYTDPVIFGAGGNPYGTSVTVDGEGNMSGEQESIKAAIQHQANRTIQVAGWVKEGLKA
ncbi:NAD(P)H:quinone oxidoreductase [Tindallia californiensis]|uniref:NAD(P)H dehydrogenase (Quinone) n=1 Tax=Tindallia californiensis TaxID=159292 RepID=A0A1H3MS55_9FIRM|nr:NAD(P)H:quinone oxidoreductase [Tindallia californiensis]SDY79248.1 NAD(P)H dehydrogenase (quinone) [Tindallia californiensis]